MEKEEKELQFSTVWSFPKRGKYSIHQPNFPGNWAPQVPRNLIIKYSKQGDYILDPFLGSGTTLIEAKLLNRCGIGVDLNEKHIDLVARRLQTIEGRTQKLYPADTRNLYFITDNSIDLALLHPPYANAIVYSDDPADLSNIVSVEMFCNQFRIIIREIRRVVKSNGLIALMIGDLRRRKRVIPLGFKVLEVCLNEGLDLKEIIIKIQHNCSSTERWKPIAKKLNFLLLMHEYIFLFEN